MTELSETLCRLGNEARLWLLEEAAPLWSERGRTPTGLFPERMTLAGEPDSSFFRTFVQARHIFAFVKIGSLGWAGPWRELVEETMQTLLDKARRDDGFFVHCLDANADPLDARADLYDQAFVLLSLASAGAALDRTSLFDQAETLLDCLENEWAHPFGGFHEGEIAETGVRRQNPHMHLLEAAIALYESSGRERFRDFAVEIARLAIDKFIEPRSGAIIEYYSDHLTPLPGRAGRIVEPGHCFEWAWLFEKLTSRGSLGGESFADRLVAFARRNGLDERRGVVLNELLIDGSTADGRARLWPQTERLRASAARYVRLGTNEEAVDAIAAAESLVGYLQVPVRGLWRDKLKEDGEWVEELAPGSSLYHIVGAISELVRATPSSPVLVRA